MLLLLPILLVFLGSAVDFGECAPEAVTTLGKVQGELRTSLNGRSYAAFEGVPYGKPPVGDLRFEEPVLADPWDGTWDATKARACIQFTMDLPGQDEDCLFLNVYVPSENIDPGKNYDVVVHIHGGGFMTGAGYVVNAKYMMDKDIIVVTMNYRLGPLGFISTEDDVLPGNNGLKDQNLALKWIQKNIASFGGNPNSVTLTGMSAGAASTQLHFLSPMSKGLFSKGISHGGSALNPWVMKERPVENAQKLASLVGCPDSPTSELKKCLKTIPSSSFLENLNEFFGFGPLPLAPFAPVVEKTSNGAFLNKHPYQIMKDKDVYDVPYVISSTKDEGVVLTGGLYQILEVIDKDWNYIAQYLLDYNYTIPESKREEVATKIKDYYLGSGQNINKDNFVKLTQMFTDRIVAFGTETSAKLISQANSSPLHYYLFSYKGEANKIVDVLYGGLNLDVVCHTDDTIYFYGFLALNDYSPSDKKMWEDCQDLLFSFASTGTPKFNGASWSPTKDTELTYLQISGPGQSMLETVKNLTPVDFWTSLGFDEFA